MKYLFSTIFILSMLGAIAQQEIPLYTGRIPNSKNCGTNNETEINQLGLEVLRTFQSKSPKTSHTNLPRWRLCCFSYQS